MQIKEETKLCHFYGFKNVHFSLKWLVQVIKKEVETVKVCPFLTMRFMGNS